MSKVCKISLISSDNIMAEDGMSVLFIYYYNFYTAYALELEPCFPLLLCAILFYYILYFITYFVDLNYYAAHVINIYLYHHTWNYIERIICLRIVCITVVSA